MLPAAAAAGQKPATEALLDHVLEKTERMVTDTVQLAGTESGTAPESENKVLEQNSGVLQKHWSTPVHACQMLLLRELLPADAVKIGLSALLDMPLTD